MTAEVTAANKQLELQLDKKLENAKQVEQIKLGVESEKTKKLEIAKGVNRQKVLDEFQAKATLAKLSSTLRTTEKKKTAKLKSKAEKKEITVEAQHMASARKSMHTMTGNNGGSFPNPGTTSIGEVSCCSSIEMSMVFTNL